MSLAYGVLRAVRNIGFFTFASGAAAAEPVQIAAFGDSLTAGYGLQIDEGLVPQLQNWLDAAGAEIELINAGVSGDTTAGGLARVDWALANDVDAMILALGANDYLRGLSPELARENLTGIIERAEAKGVAVMLVGLNVGSNYGAAYKAAFDGIYPALAEEFDLQLTPFFYDALIAEAGSQQAMTAYLQADGLHPTPAGVALIVDAFGPEVLRFAQGLE